MRKVVMLLVVAVVLALAGSVMAFDVGGTLKKAGESAAKGAVASGINKELGKGQYQCTWNKATQSVEGCDLKKIAAYLSAQHKVAEGSGTYTDYDINIHVNDYDGYKKVKSQLHTLGVGSWDITQQKSSGNKVKFTVAID